MDEEVVSKRAALDAVLLDYLAAGWSHEQVAAAASVSSKTVQRRLRDRAFAAELGRRRAARMEALTARLSAITDDAVSVIVASFESKSSAVRLRAADLALTWALRTRRELDLEARIARLEHPEATVGETGVDGDVS